MLGVCVCVYVCVYVCVCVCVTSRQIGKGSQEWDHVCGRIENFAMGHDYN